MFNILSARWPTKQMEVEENLNESQSGLLDGTFKNGYSCEPERSPRNQRMFLSNCVFLSLNMAFLITLILAWRLKDQEMNKERFYCEFPPCHGQGTTLT